MESDRKLSSQKPAAKGDRERDLRRAVILFELCLLLSPLEFLHIVQHVSPILICNYCRLFVEQQHYLLLFIYGFMPPTNFEIAQSAIVGAAFEYERFFFRNYI